MNAAAVEALERLCAGNRRYVANASTINITDIDRRKLATGQRPFAVILGCSDSRVPTEVVFDQGVGDLFVIRIAGNIVQPSQIGSVEFAAQKFGVQLVVVLGHSCCGAVEVAIEQLRQPPARQSPNMAAIVDRIRPAIEPLLAEDLDAETLMQRAVRDNVRYAANALRHGSRVVERLIESDELAIVGAEYSLDSGVVDFFDGIPVGRA